MVEGRCLMVESRCLMAEGRCLIALDDLTTSAKQAIEKTLLALSRNFLISSSTALRLHEMDLHSYPAHPHVIQVPEFNFLFKRVLCIFPKNTW